MKFRFLSLPTCGSLLIVVGLAGTADAQNAAATHPAVTDSAALPSSALTPKGIQDPFRLAIVGDVVVTTPKVDSTEREREAVFELVRRADLAIGNDEGPIADLKTPGLAPFSNGMLLMQPQVAKDLAAMGLDMVSTANNHATDWGPAGVMETLRLLDDPKIVHAGTGPTLEQARAPAYAKTAAGTVALVATASSFNPPAMANDMKDDMPARAGLSVLRTRRITLVSADELGRLKAIAARRATGRIPSPAPEATQVSIGDETFRQSDRTGVTYTVNTVDRLGVLKAVQEARQKADLVVFTIHAHESATGLDDDNPEPPDFLPTLFHDAVDAGADVIVGGGPHAMRGIEIYKSRPIFYGVGVFFLDAKIYLSQELEQYMAGTMDDAQEAVRPPTFPQAKGGNPRAWYDGAVALIDYDGGRARRVQLIPLDLRPDGERGSRGTPIIATGNRAHEILTRLQQASHRFGTIIRIEHERGIITLN